MSAATSKMTAPLAARWAALNTRQQRLALGGGALLGIALFIALVWLPLERAQRRLLERLPAVHAQHAALQRDAEEVKRLRSLPATLATSGSSAARLPDVNGLRTLFPGAEVTALGSSRYRVSLADGRFGRWLDGVRGLNGQLVIAELTVSRAAPGSDALRIEAVLQPAKAGQ